MDLSFIDDFIIISFVDIDDCVATSGLNAELYLYSGITVKVVSIILLGLIFGIC